MPTRAPQLPSAHRHGDVLSFWVWLLRNRVLGVREESSLTVRDLRSWWNRAGWKKVLVTADPCPFQEIGVTGSETHPNTSQVSRLAVNPLLEDGNHVLLVSTAPPRALGAG